MTDLREQSQPNFKSSLTTKSDFHHTQHLMQAFTGQSLLSPTILNLETVVTQSFRTYFSLFIIHSI